MSEERKWNSEAEEFWKEWVKDLNDDVAYYKKLARERGELNVKLAYQLDAHKPPTKSDEELNTNRLVDLKTKGYRFK